MTTPVTCATCGKTAAELIPAAAVAAYYEDADHTADDYAREDGTYNAATNRFACDACYIAQGMPANHVSSGLGNWIVDDDDAPEGEPHPCRWCGTPTRWSDCGRPACEAKAEALLDELAEAAVQRDLARYQP